MKQETSIELKGGISWAWKIVTGVVALLAVFMTKLLDFTFSIEGYSIALSLFWKEIIAVVLVGAAFLILLVMSRRIVPGFRYTLASTDTRQKAQIFTMSIAALLVVAVALSVALYQGRKLLLGNLIQYRQAHGLYLAQAQQYFNEGDYNAAYIEVETCVNVLKRERCAVVLDALESRQGLIRKTNELIANDALDLDGKFALLRDLTNISGSDQQLREFSNRMDRKYEEVYEKYLAALNQITLGELDAAVNELDAVDKAWTDFGHNRFLRDELAKFKQLVSSQVAGSIWRDFEANGRYPYLSALKNMGMAEFAQYTADSSTLALRLR